MRAKTTTKNRVRKVINPYYNISSHLVEFLQHQNIIRNTYEKKSITHFKGIIPVEHLGEFLLLLYLDSALPQILSSVKNTTHFITHHYGNYKFIPLLKEEAILADYFLAEFKHKAETQFGISMDIIKILPGNPRTLTSFGEVRLLTDGRIVANPLVPNSVVGWNTDRKGA